MPSVPPAAMAPVASESSYRYRRISGSDTRPMVSAAANDEPDRAEKPAHATIDADARLPLKRPSQLWAARYRSWLIPEITARFPISMNSGRMVREYREATANTSPASTARTAPGRIAAIPATPTISIASPTGTRIRSSARRARNPSRAMLLPSISRRAHWDLRRSRTRTREAVGMRAAPSRRQATPRAHGRTGCGRSKRWG